MCINLIYQIHQPYITTKVMLEFVPIYAAKTYPIQQVQSVSENFSNKNTAENRFTQKKVFFFSIPNILQFQY